MTNTRFAFWVGLVLYVTFLLCEYLRPGFVSTALNPHVLLLVVTLCAVCDRKAPHTRYVRFFAVCTWAPLLLLGIVCGAIVAHLGSVFGIMQFWMTIACAFAPLILWRASRCL